MQGAQHKVKPVFTDHLHGTHRVGQGLAHLHPVGDDQLLREDILRLVGGKTGIHQAFAILLLLKLLHIAGIGDADARDLLIHGGGAERCHQILALGGIV